MPRNVGYLGMADDIFEPDLEIAVLQLSIIIVVQSLLPSIPTEHITIEQLCQNVNETLWKAPTWDPCSDGMVQVVVDDDYRVDYPYVAAAIHKYQVKLASTFAWDLKTVKHDRKPREGLPAAGSLGVAESIKTIFVKPIPSAIYGAKKGQSKEEIFQLVADVRIRLTRTNRQHVPTFHYPLYQDKLQHLAAHFNARASSTLEASDDEIDNPRKCQRSKRFNELVPGSEERRRIINNVRESILLNNNAYEDIDLILACSIKDRGTREACVSAVLERMGLDDADDDSDDDSDSIEAMESLLGAESPYNSTVEKCMEPIQEGYLVFSNAHKMQVLALYDTVDKALLSEHPEKDTAKVVIRLLRNQGQLKFLKRRTLLRWVLQSKTAGEQMSL